MFWWARLSSESLMMTTVGLSHLKNSSWWDIIGPKLAQVLSKLVSPGSEIFLSPPPRPLHVCLGGEHDTSLLCNVKKLEDNTSKSI